MSGGEQKNREPLQFKNLADMKRHIAVGTELVATFHSKHPDLVGLTRVVTEVLTNGFYSKIKGQPDHRWSTCSYVDNAAVEGSHCVHLPAEAEGSVERYAAHVRSQQSARTRGAWLRLLPCLLLVSRCRHLVE